MSSDRRPPKPDPLLARAASDFDSSKLNSEAFARDIQKIAVRDVKYQNPDDAFANDMQELNNLLHSNDTLSAAMTFLGPVQNGTAMAYRLPHVTRADERNPELTDFVVVDEIGNRHPRQGNDLVNKAAKDFKGPKYTDYSDDLREISLYDGGNPLNGHIVQLNNLLHTLHKLPDKLSLVDFSAYGFARYVIGNKRYRDKQDWLDVDPYGQPVQGGGWTLDGDGQLQEVPWPGDPPPGPDPPTPT
jgi:hypothetical protein